MDAIKLYTDEELTAIPDLETYKKNLSCLKTTDLSGLSFNELSQEFMSNAIIFPQLIGWFNPESFNTFTFYRVRLDINSEVEDLSQIATYSYPKYSSSNGRANIKGHSVFYCSNDPWCAIMESKPKLGSIIYLSIWKTKAIQRIKASICLPKIIPNSNKFHEMALEVYEYAKQHSKANGQDKSSQIEELHHFKSLLFQEEAAPYILTSWMSYQMLYANSNDFILYPSIIKNNYNNMAFSPNSMESNLILDKVIKYKITKYNSPYQFNITDGQVGELKEDRVKYRNSNSKMEVDINSFPI